MKVLYTIILSTSLSLQATVIVRGNSDQSPFGFTSTVTTKAFDHKTGSLIVGLDTGGDDFALSRAPRPTFHSQPRFIPLASGDVSNQSIEFLTLSFSDNAATLATFVGKSDQPFSSNTISALPVLGGTSTTSAALLDVQEQQTAGIVNIAASNNSIVAAVRPADGNFGAANGGIALLAINRKTDGTIELITKDATTGTDGNKAVELQANSVALKGNGALNVTFAAGEENNVALYFDEKLNLFYIGVRIQVGTNPFSAGFGKAVALIRLNTQNNSVDLQEIVIDAAIVTPVEGSQIIVGQRTLLGGSPQLRALQLRTLHASTGPSYLIVNGGTGTTDQVSNKIFALPLVNLSSSPDHGKLANKTAALVNGTFIEVATLPAHVPNSTDVAAQVGFGDLPIEPSTAVSDIVIIGDTVYACVNQPPDATNDTGVFYSQALFDAQGKIIRWTPWTKRATPFNAFGQTKLADDQTHDGRVSFFSIDPTTGNAWIVEGTTGKVVGITAWAKSGTDKTLVAELNKKIASGCFSVLDLDQATRGFLTQTAHRYAFFGGNNTVIFTHVSQAVNTNSLTSPQTVVTDFSLPENFQLSSLPENAGVVRSLEYSKRDANLNNFFFAGTQTGLFIFSKNDGDGFTSSELLTVNMTPFTDGVWQKLGGITGSVVDMKCAGNSLYVLTTQFTSTKPFNDILYNIRFNNVGDVDDVIGNITIIAQTGSGIFETVTAFLGVGIVATGREQLDVTAPNDRVEVREQLVLATSAGLFKTNANQTIQNTVIAKGSADATTQAEANWEKIANTDGAFLGIGTIETPVQHTLWPFSLEDTNNFKTFTRGSIHQISGAESPALLTQPTRADQPLIGIFTPAQFNALDSNETLDIITNFWSDGGRRFFIFNRITDPVDENKLGVFPFDAQKFNLVAPTILNDSLIRQIKSFFWVKTIGATGLILAGTGQGVIGLE